MSVQVTQYKWKLIWRNIVLYILMHVGGFYGLYLIFVTAKWKTTVWTLFTFCLAILGVTAGSHRLWSHKSYKANLPLRIFLSVLHTLSLQNHVYDWARDHRVHHKYVDTDADPHNSRRGFFFSHVGWLFIEKLPAVATKLKEIDMSDLEADPVVMIQKKYYFVLWAPLIGFILPAFVPWYYWNENFLTAFYVASLFRYALVTNVSFCINSLAHALGTRPYDKNILPRDNNALKVLTLGEGWHNYHHTFPWDYKGAEYGKQPNLTTGLIDLMAAIGWAYDLKSVSREMILKRVNRTGDGTVKFEKTAAGADVKSNGLLWGWGDEDMTTEELSAVDITKRH